MPEAPKWIDVDETRVVFRFVKHASRDHENFAENFMSDEEYGKKALPDVEHPDYLLGMSAFDSEEHARDAWADIYAKALARGSRRNKRRQRAPKIIVGEYIAEVELTPGEGFEIDAPSDSDPRGHLWIKGDKTKLARAVRRVYAAARNAI